MNLDIVLGFINYEFLDNFRCNKCFKISSVLGNEVQ